MLLWSKSGNDSDTISYLHFRLEGFISSFCSTIPILPCHLSIYLKVPTSCFQRYHYSCPSIDRGRKEKTVPTAEMVMDITSKIYIETLSKPLISSLKSFR